MFRTRNMNFRDLMDQISSRGTITINYKTFISRLKVLFKRDNNSTQLGPKFLPCTKHQVWDVS
jgi:hypothetical protein